MFPGRTKTKIPSGPRRFYAITSASIHKLHEDMTWEMWIGIQLCLLRAISV